ncbi:MAG: hypothetical protein RH859_00550 [Longimicrobiales bacterium]
MSPSFRSLEARVEGVRGYLRSAAFRAATVWFAAGGAVVLAVAWTLAGSDGWRQGSDLPLVLDLLLIGLGVAAFAGVTRGARHWFAEARLASAMERASGLQTGTVRGSLELGRAVPPGTSVALAGRAARSAVEGLRGDHRELSGDLGRRVAEWTRRGMGALAVGTVTVVVLAVAAPQRAALAWSGLVRPLGLMIDPVLEPVVLTPGDVEVLRGSDVEIAIVAPGRESVDVAWQAAGDVARTQTVILDEAGRGHHLLPAVSAQLEYEARAPDGARAGPYRIVPVDPLFVSDLRVEVAYPPHTGLPPDEYRGEVPPLVLPVGTRLSVEGRASRRLAVAALTGEDGDAAIRFDVEGPDFEGTWVPRRDGTYPWRFTDEDGGPAEIQPEPLVLALQADQPPLLTIPLPGRDTILPMNLRQPLILEARDDYGLGRLELVAWRVTSFGERQESVVQGLDLGGTRAALARPVLDLTRWGLLPGDTVRYYAEVVDNAPGGQVTRTREYVLRMPGAAEMRREAERRIDDVAERLEELAEEAGERADEARDMERRAAAEDTRPEQGRGRPEPEQAAGFEEQEELRRALEGQEEMAAEVDSLRAELEALQQAMEEAGQADPGLQEDLDELQELLEQVSGDELRAQMERLSEALEEQSARSADEAMEDLARQQEEFRDRLEESLERFRRAAVEQDFRATQSEAEELARQQEALADAMEENDQPELRAEQQEAMGDRASDLQERMERLQERLEQLGEQDAAGGVEQARQRAQEAAEQMQQAGQQAQQGQQQEASDEAREAAEAMEDAARELSEAQQQMQQQQAEAAQEALRATADDALSLARRQAQLRDRMRTAGQEEVDRMRADEASLVQGVRNMAQNLTEATEGAMDQSRELSTQMGRAMESIQRTIDAMESRRGPSPSPQAAADQAIADLNQLALMALAGAEQMSQGEGQGQSSQQQMSEQMEQMAQQQGQLNNQTSQLMPLQLGQQAMSEQLQEIAEQQQQMAEDLGDLSEQPGSEEASLGDLEQLAEEAAALAEQLNQGRLSPEVVQRQEELFRRLLDAGRSLEREEESEERESERAAAFERGQVVPLTPEQLGALRFRMPDAEQLQRLSPAVRQLVIQYFERLNTGTGRPPGGGA